MKPNIKQWFFPHDDKNDHFKALDGLRGLAVLLVMLSHSSNSGLMFHEHLNFQASGKAGVFLFFILSAYLLDRQIAIAFLCKKASSMYWRNYFLRRFLRIFPLFLVALLAYYYLNLTGIIPTKINNFYDIPQHILLLQGKTIFWSVPVEFKYYFLSPLIIWFCHRFLKWDYIKIFVLILLLMIFSLLFENKYRLSDISTLKYLPLFLSGTAISIYELLIKNISFQKYSNLFDLLGILVVIVIFLSFPYYFKQLLNFELKLHRPPFYMLYAVLWSLLLISVKYSKGFINSFFSLKPLRFIGTISFSLYLFHMLSISFVRRVFEIPEYLQVYAFFVISIIISSITYLLIELPLSKIKICKRRISKKEIELN